MRYLKSFTLLFLLIIGLSANAQIKSSPDRVEGDGPFKQLIIRGVILINGAGAPPRGPVDVVVEATG